MLRKPIVAGQFYEDDKESLKEQIRHCFLNGPGLPAKKDKDIFGVISPHAGFAFSGYAAAYSFKEIAESKPYDCFILIGLGHSGQKSCVSLADWETPLGIAKNDNVLGKAIMKHSGIGNDEHSHAIEHSIEVQLPFLQFCLGNDISIVPMIVDSDFEKIAEGIKKAIDESGKRCCIVASSDFTHYGINYGYMPFKDNVKDNLYKLDNEAIEQIKRLSSFGFMELVERTGATICGRYPIACLIELANSFKKKKVELLKYYTSGDIVNDYNNAVGYASISIR